MPTIQSVSIRLRGENICNLFSRVIVFLYLWGIKPKLRIMKRLVLFTVLVLVLVSCGKSEKEFDEKLTQARVLELQVELYNAIIHDAIVDAWHDAIFKNKTPSGRYTRDFDTALSEVCDSMDKYGFRDSVQSLNSQLLQMASELEPPASRKECYDDYVEIVSCISNLTRKCCSVSGSYKSYCSETNDLFETVSEKKDKFKIKYGNILNNKNEEK